MPELFDFSTYAPALAPKRPQVRTPLGLLILDVVVGEQSAKELPRDAFVTDDNSCTGFTFPFHAVNAEVLICPVKPSLPPGRWVEQCLACVLRAAAKTDNMSLTYRCVWSHETDPPENGANNGERLQAYTWDDGQFEVSLGTLDEEGLYSDAGSKLPARWRQPIFDANLAGIYVSSIGNRGISIQPPRLMKGESCELFFAIAWGSYREPKSDTWFAVDFSSPERLRWWLGQQPFAAQSGPS